LSVSNFAKKRPISKQICMKFSGKVGNGPVKRLLNFDIWIHLQGLFSGFVTVESGSSHSVILICQMAALVKRALAEVCTVLVLLVITDVDIVLTVIN